MLLVRPYWHVIVIASNYFCSGFIAVHSEFLTTKNLTTVSFYFDSYQHAELVSTQLLNEDLMGLSERLSSLVKFQSPDVENVT